MLSHRDHRAAWSLGLWLMASGCVHRGAGWEVATHAEAPSTVVEPSFGIVALGQARPGTTSRTVAKQLESLLAAERAAGRPTVVVWLGHDFGPPGPDRLRPPHCPDTSVWLEPGMTELAATLTDHASAGESLWGVRGPDGFRCDPPTGGPPIAQPGGAYVVRVDAAGHTELVSTCEGSPVRCSVAPADPGAWIDLVFVDPSAWMYPELDRLGSPAHSALVELDALFVALEVPTDVPRLLVSSVPIESAGVHGYGGRRGISALRWHPDTVRRAIGEGRFVGVIGGLERDLQASSDLSDAVVRSDRSFLPRPVFQVVSGAAGGASSAMQVSRGNSLINELDSNHPGFAHLRIGVTTIDVELHARVARRWQVATVSMPLSPEFVAGPRETPPIQPCLRCDPERGAADGPVWFD